MNLDKFLATLATILIVLNVGVLVFWFGPEILHRMPRKDGQLKSESSGPAVEELSSSKKFIELGKESVPVVGKALIADLEQSKIFLYENGKSIADFPILSVGKSGTPWETPGGDFSILLKKPNHFSSIGLVWMPFSMQFLGNYFIHGWPYYPNNEPVPEGYSGGCIRLSTTDAEKTYQFADRGTLLRVIKEGDSPASNSGLNFLSSTQNILPEVSAQSYLVADLASGEIVWEKSAQDSLSIYSLSKLMFALVALDQIDPFASVKVSASAVSTWLQVGNLKEGEVMEVRHLIYPLLLEGSNTANRVIAEKIGSERFVEEMNKRADSINLKNTQYTDSLGLEAENVSTAEDMFRLIRHLFYNKRYLLDISKLKEFSCCGHRWLNRVPFTIDESFGGGYAGAEGVFAGVFSVKLSNNQTRELVFVVLGSSNLEKDVSNLLKQTKVLFNPESQNKEATLLAVGDIMMDRGVARMVDNKGGGDFAYVFKNIRELKKGADILLGNLEGPVSDRGADLGNLYSFRMSPKVLPVLKEIGFDVLNVANNHVGDWDLVAFLDSLERLSNHGLAYVGGGLSKTEAEKPVIIEKNGLKVGFLGFSDVGPNWLAATEQEPGILLANDVRFSEIISRATQQTDVLIVTVHFGEEYEVLHNDRQENLAKTALRAGAHAVIGHHPHVVQDEERLDHQYIAYSLGNFVFDQNFSEETMSGLALKLKLSRAGIVGVEKLPISINSDFQPGFVNYR